MARGTRRTLIVCALIAAIAVVVAALIHVCGQKPPVVVPQVIIETPVISDTTTGPIQAAPRLDTVWLSQAPNTWGKRIPGSSGMVVLTDESPGAFTGRVQLTGLRASSVYMLTLNGKPPHASNELLRDIVVGGSVVNGTPERYMDIRQVSTDAGGAAEVPFTAQLPAGQYHVKFFVKDRSDWRIVLYTDFLSFTVE